MFAQPEKDEASKKEQEYNESFRSIIELANKSILSGDRAGFLLAQKKIFLAEYSSLRTLLAIEEYKAAIKMTTSTMLCIAELDKQWKKYNGG